MSQANTLELQHLAGADKGAAPVGAIDLAVPAGRSLALLGGARAGKSSLLRLIAGFVGPAGGRVMFNGYDLHDVPPHRRPFAFLGSQHALFPHMRVAQNVAYGLRTRRLGHREERQRIAEALELVGVTGLEKAYPEALNPDQRQRVALARALAVHPLVLLLDDAFAALDPLAAARLMATLAELRRRAGMTVLFGTTDGAEAMNFGDRMAVLSEGTLLQEGTPGELYDRPDHALTASLTGPANLLEGRATGRGLEIAGLGELAAVGSVAAGTHAALALRPDRIELHLDRPGDTALQGEIERTAWGAGGLTAHVRIAQGRLALVARLDGRRLGADDLPEGRKVWCTWAFDDARLVRT